MNRTAQQRQGFIIIELLASLGLMGMLVVLLAAMTVSYQRADNYYMTQRRLQLAVEGQMESFRAQMDSMKQSPVIEETGAVGLDADYK